MNREIILCFLNDYNDKRTQFDGRIKKELCCNFNRDLPLIISRVHGARKTVDVGLYITGGEGTKPYEPYRRAGFLLVEPHSSDECDMIREGFLSSFERGYVSVLVLQHSVPSLPAVHIEQALGRLRERGGIVLGPLTNGGFYLIGMVREAFDSLYRLGLLSLLCICDPEKRKETTEKIGKEISPPYLLPEWYQVKTPQDLKRLYSDCKGDSTPDARWTRQTSCG
ncbi:MAG: DUF2064 domain-containing protein [Spirochaetes bacterium]|nr:DUF2064 domain-containing protein [Spirochaetota bacterium]